MDMLEIVELIRLINHSSIDEIEIKNNETRLFIKKSEIIKNINEPELQIKENLDYHSYINESIDLNPIEITKMFDIHIIYSDVIGTFVPFLKSGDFVEENALIARCSVTGLNINHEIISKLNGEIIEVLAEEGEIIDFGQPLYRISVAIK